MIAGWRLGNSMDGVQADFFRVPYAQANLAKDPRRHDRRAVRDVADIASTGVSAAEAGDVKVAITP